MSIGKVHVVSKSEKSHVERARQLLNDIECDLGVFMLRDLKLTEEAGLREFAFSANRSEVVKADLEYLLDKLDHYMRPCKLCTENPRSYEAHSPGSPPLVDSDYCSACQRTVIIAAGDRNRMRSVDNWSANYASRETPWEIPWPSPQHVSWRMVWAT